MLYFCCVTQCFSLSLITHKLKLNITDINVACSQILRGGWFLLIFKKNSWQSSLRRWYTLRWTENPWGCHESNNVLDAKLRRFIIIDNRILSMIQSGMGVMGRPTWFDSIYDSIDIFDSYTTSSVTRPQTIRLQTNPNWLSRQIPTLEASLRPPLPSVICSG